MKVERSSVLFLPVAVVLAATTAGPTLAQPGGGEKGPSP